MDDSSGMSISADSPSGETLNWGPLALLLRRQYEFPFGIDIVQFSIFFQFSRDGGVLTQSDSTILFLPFFHIYGQVVTLMSTLYIGCKIVVMEKYDTDLLLTYMDKYQVRISLFILVHRRDSNVDQKNVYHN